MERLEPELNEHFLIEKDSESHTDSFTMIRPYMFVHALILTSSPISISKKKKKKKYYNIIIILYI